MKKNKRTKLEAAGWAIGSVQEFLGLSDADATMSPRKITQGSIPPKSMKK